MQNHSYKLMSKDKAKQCDKNKQLHKHTVNNTIHVLPNTVHEYSMNTFYKCAQQTHNSLALMQCGMAASTSNHLFIDVAENNQCGLWAVVRQRPRVES